MTICIAAIATEDGKELVVFSTDHMVTTHAGQFEHSIIKYKQLNSHTIAMLSGHALLIDDLTKLESLPDTSFEKIERDIYENFKKKRKEVIKNEIFNVYGIDETFFINALKSPVPNPFVHSILDKVSNFELHTSIILTGFDDGKARISEITESGHVDFRPMNFHAIGSGTIQAMNTLLFQKHSKFANLCETIYNVYKAKRNAEVMEGVGKETEVLILREGGLEKLSSEILLSLRDTACSHILN